MDIVIYCGFAVLVAVTTLYLKKLSPELALTVLVASGVVTVKFVIDKTVPFFSDLIGLCSESGLKESMTVLLKSVGICIITVFASGICRDFSLDSLGSKVEFVGRCSLIILTFPFLKNILAILGELL